METKKHLQNQSQTLEQLFERAVEAIPYDLTPTSITMGSFQADKDNYVEYSEEFTFPVGRMFDEDLIAGGWVELRCDEGEVTITAFFSVARNGDWETGRVLPDNTAVQGDYDINEQRWDFRIDRY